MISPAASSPINTQIQAAVPLPELEGAVVVGVVVGRVMVTDGRVVVICTVVVTGTVTSVVVPAEVVVSTVDVVSVVVVSAAAPLLTTAAARSRPAEKRMASPDNLIERGTVRILPDPGTGVSRFYRSSISLQRSSIRPFFQTSTEIDQVSTNAATIP